MRVNRKVSAWIATLTLGLTLCVWAQESSPPLGDIARSTRKERSAPGHVAGKQLVNEEEDGPDTTGVWRVRLCTWKPCYELSVVMPATPKWTRAKEEPRPVLIPLAGHEEDLSHAIRVYVGGGLAPMYGQVNDGKRTFLQGWFARAEYFGRAAHIDLDQHTQIDGEPSIISHFMVEGKPRYRGLSVVSASPDGTYGFACVFRDEDSAAAASVCDAIVKSARNEALEPARPVMTPTDPPRDPPGNDPSDDDPQNLDQTHLETCART